MYKYFCKDAGPEHIPQDPCGVFLTEKYLGEKAFCPCCGMEHAVEFLGEVEVLEVEK